MEFDSEQWELLSDEECLSTDAGFWQWVLVGGTFVLAYYTFVYGVGYAIGAYMRP